MSPTSTSRFRGWIPFLVAGLVAAGLTVGGLTAAGVGPTQRPSSTALTIVGPHPKPLKHKLVYQSGTGNDSTCIRNQRLRPCLTIAKACTLARPNYVIYRIGGSPRRQGYKAACSASSEVANIWVDTNGGTCTYSSTQVAYVDAAACTDPAAAYSAIGANNGKLGLIKGGAYTTQWNFTTAMSKTLASGTCNFNYGGASDFSNCTTFRPASGETVTLAYNPGGASQVSQVKVCVDGLSLSGINITKTDFTEASTGDTISNNSVGVGSGDSSCQPGGNPPHDNYFGSNSYGGQAGASGGSVNVWFVGGTATGTDDQPWQYGGIGNNGGTPGVNHGGIVGVTFQGFNFVNDDSTHHHMECIHMDGQDDHVSMANIDLQSCPVEGIRFEAEAIGGGNGSMTNNLFENITCDSGATSGCLNPDCHDNNCTMTNNTVRFSSFSGTGFAPQTDCNLVGGRTCTSSGNKFYGNVATSCASSASTFGLGWASTYNVYTGTQSGICIGDATSVYSSTPSFLSPGTPNYDLHLNGSLQAADNLVPTGQVCPPTDSDGTARPQNTNCDAGAFERLLPVTPQSGASQATCSGGCSDPGYVPDATTVGCAHGSAITQNTTFHIVSLGDVNNGTTAECRQYGYLVPTNLNPSSSNQPAALLMANNPARTTCGTGGNDEFKTTFNQYGDGAVAAANRYIIVVLAKPCNPSRASWLHPAIDIPAGSSTTDGPYLAAVVSDIETRFHVDPNRVYLTGSSSGGGLVNGMACDTTYSTLFRGYGIDANTMPITGNTTTGPNNSTEVCPSTNQSFFYVNVQGMSDTQQNPAGVCLATHCLASLDENRRFWAAHMGCGATPSGSGSGTPFGTPSSSNTDYLYSSCAFGSPAQIVDIKKIATGTHGTAGVTTSPTYPGGTCTGCNDFYFQRDVIGYFYGSSW